jgi:hypothetical protein
VVSIRRYRFRPLVGAIRSENVFWTTTKEGIVTRGNAFGTATALLIGGLLINPTSSSAQTFNTQAASVHCNTIIGTASIKPPITTASTGTAIIKVKATLGGCASTGATPSEPTIVSGSIGGTLNTVGGAGCAGLLGAATITGNLVAKWKVASGQKLDFSSTTASNGTITGGIFGPESWGGSYGQFTLSGQTLAANSAFAGATPGTVAVTGEDIVSLTNLCTTSPPGKGIKTIHLAIGGVTL